MHIYIFFLLCLVSRNAVTSWHTMCSKQRRGWSHVCITQQSRGRYSYAYFLWKYHNLCYWQVMFVNVIIFHHLHDHLPTYLCLWLSVCLSLTLFPLTYLLPTDRKLFESCIFLVSLGEVCCYMTNVSHIRIPPILMSCVQSLDIVYKLYLYNHAWTHDY